MTEPAPTLLLVEDRPGDARLVREMIASASWDRRLDAVEELLGVDRPEATEGTAAGATVEHVDRLEAGLAALDRGDVDIVLLDLNLPDSRGLDTLDAVVGHDADVPVVVLTGMDDQNLGLRALDHGAQEYLVKGELTGDMLVRTVVHAIQRHRFEREIRRQHDRLATISEIGLLVQGIAGSLIDLGTVEEIEETVLERLVGSPVYSAAWIGEVEQAAGTVEPRTTAVPDGFLEGRPVSVGSDEGVPVAVATDDLAVGTVIEAPDAEEYGDWRSHAETHGYRAMATVPISYNDLLYGVLFVYTDRPSAFGTEEHDLIDQLGNVMGHAIHAVDQRAALMGDATTQIELILPGVVPDGLGEGGRIDIVTTVPAGDGTYLQFAESNVGPEAIEWVLSQFDSFRGLRVIDGDVDHPLVQLTFDDPPIISELAGFGGRFRSGSLLGRDYRVVLDLSGDTEVREFVDTMREAFPEVDIVAQRSVGGAVPGGVQPGPSNRELTEKQRAALEAAYYSGYFDRPRRSSGEEIAESLGISPSTLHQHLQVGLSKVLAAEFETGSGQPSTVARPTAEDAFAEE